MCAAPDPGLYLADWQSIERAAERGDEIRGRKGHSGREIEVRFDNGTSPKHSERKTPSREEAVRIGREIATMRDSRWSRAARSRHRGRRGLFFSVDLDGVRYAAG